MEGAIMLDLPNPVLNEEELDLLSSAPEECLRHAVQRGALSLDEVTADLSPRVAAVVRFIATGERLAMPEGDAIRDPGAAGRSRASPEGSDGPSLPATPEGPGDREEEWALRTLSSHAQLVHLLDEQRLTPSEAMAAAHAIDHCLGRYLTGTRYAAP
jgi:hypothetical protein